MKRGYFVYEDEGDGSGLGCVASSSKEAKKRMWGNPSFTNDEWIDLRVKWVKEANVDDLPLGEVTAKIGLERGLFGFVYDSTCPMCGEIKTIHNENGIIGCMNCIELKYATEINNKGTGDQNDQDK